MAITFIDNVNGAEYNSFVSAMNQRIQVIYLDTESNGLDPHTSNMLLLQLGVNGDVFIFDVFKVGMNVITDIIENIKKLKYTVVAHNAKFDVKLIAKETGVLLEYLHDTMLSEVMLNSGIGQTLYSLASLVEKYCSVTLEKDTRNEFIDKVFGSGFTSNQILYAGTDILYLATIYDKQLISLFEANLDRTYQLEMGLIPVVSAMELLGIKIDENKWFDLERIASEKAIEYKNLLIDLIVDKLDYAKISNGLELANLLKISVTTKRDKLALESLTDPITIKEWAKQNFNTGSPKQMQNGLGLLGIKVESTNEKVLNKLPKSPVIDALLSYREHAKLASTYGSNIVAQVNPVTGRVHTDYLNIGTQTGRFSSRNPNLQNIPATDEYRSGFISADGYSFINMDYSQQEFRLAGAVSGEEKIISAYKSGADMHMATASLIYKKPISEISKKERTFGKTLNFAILYGTTEWGLKKNLNISLEEAQDLIKQFYAGYPSLATFKRLAEDMILELGYSITPMGRRRYFQHRPLFGSPRDLEMWEAGIKREGFNHIIQGGGADVTKLALVNLFYNNPFGDNFRLVLQVHDEIGAEVKDEYLDKAVDFMSSTMRSSFEPWLNGIPAEVEYKTGKCWKH